MANRRHCPCRPGDPCPYHEDLAEQKADVGGRTVPDDRPVGVPDDPRWKYGDPADWNYPPSGRY